MVLRDPGDPGETKNKKRGGGSGVFILYYIHECLEHLESSVRIYLYLMSIHW